MTVCPGGEARQAAHGRACRRTTTAQGSEYTIL